MIVGNKNKWINLKKAETSVGFCTFLSSRKMRGFYLPHLGARTVEGVCGIGRWFLWLFLYKCTHGRAFENLFADGQTCDSRQLISPTMMLCVLCVLLPLSSTHVPSAEPG